METNRICVGYEPIEGYCLTERLGAGGYGEVWQCAAPGGLKKAIKFIFGSATGPQAAKELRSLQRVSQVYHPFLLSLERIESVGEQIIVVTELAESSLEDRLRDIRVLGGNGIPRSELLEFFRDASDALDFLATEHKLQHLDVKPGNLLIIANRIKVGDFGLLKDLEDVKQSVVGGLTPAYSAPEVFDGRPDFRSDQYSLAVSYVELLTGELPFRGSSLAELAKQHLTALPNLDGLPPADRPVVARALRKDPVERFANCRQFVDQLMRSKHAIVPVGKKATPVDRSSSPQTQQMGGVTVQSMGNAPVARERLADIPDASETNAARSLYLCLGGLGGISGAELRRRVNTASDTSLADENGWLAFDTDPNSLTDLGGDPEIESEDGFSELDTILLKIESPDVYRKAAPGTFQSLSRRWLYNIPRIRRTEGIRPLALLPLIQHRQYAKSRVMEQLHRLMLLASADAQPKVVVYMMTSLHGGTGSGILAEIGVIVREALEELQTGELAGVEVSLRGFATIAESMYAGAVKMAPAAAIATLSELTYHMSPMGNVPSINAAESAYSARRRKPFDSLALVHGGMLGDAAEAHKAASLLADCVQMDASRETGTCLDLLRDRRTTRRWLRTMHVAPLAVAKQLHLDSYAKFCAVQALGVVQKDINRAAFPQGAPADNHIQLSNTALVNAVAAALWGSPDAEPNAGGKVQSADESTSNYSWQRRLTTDRSELQDVVHEDVQRARSVIKRLIESRSMTLKQSTTVLQILRASLSAPDAPEKDGLFQAIIRSGTQESTASGLRNQLEHYVAIFLVELQKLEAEASARYPNAVDQINALRQSIASHLDERDVRNVAAQITASHTVRALTQRVATELALELYQVASSTLGLDAEAVATRAAKTAIRFANTSDIGFATGKAGQKSIDEQMSQGLASATPPLAASGGKFDRLAVGADATLEQIAAQDGASPLLDDLLQTTSIVKLAAAPSKPTILAEATELPVDLLVRNLWHPNLDTFKLAEKLRTRVDVDWAPTEMLLETEGHTTTVPTEKSDTTVEDSDEEAVTIPAAQTPAPIASDGMGADGATVQLVAVSPVVPPLTS